MPRRTSEPTGTRDTGPARDAAPGAPPRHGSGSAPDSVRPFDTARRAADLVAVLDREPVAPVADMVAGVVAVLVAHGEPEPVSLGEGDVARLRVAARELRQVFTADDTAGAAAVLNRILARHARPPRLTRHGGTPWHLHVDADDDGDWVDWFAASSAHALAVLLAERQAPPGGVCAAPDCAHPYVDDGRGGPRRYCSRRCATRVRVARHRGRPA